VVPAIERPILENNPEKSHAAPKNKQGLGCMNQSSFDCIFADPLATPNNKKGTAKETVESSCIVAMHPAPLMSIANPCL